MVYSKDDLWIGCRIRLNDGQVATVTDDHEDDEMIWCLIDGDDDAVAVYVGQPLFVDGFGLWTDELLHEGHIINDDGENEFVEFVDSQDWSNVVFCEDE